MVRALKRLLLSSSDPATLAVVDLGSNSFRLEIGRVEGDQIFRLDTWRETIRFGGSATFGEAAAAPIPAKAATARRSFRCMARL